MHHLAEPIHITNTPVRPCASAGNLNTKFMLTEFRTSAAIGRGRSGSCEEGSGFTLCHSAQDRTHLRAQLCQ